MGTLSAQFAHLLSLDADAASPAIAAWTPPFLTAQVLPWAQHADLVWPTLSPTDRHAVIADTKLLLADKKPAALASLQNHPLLLLLPQPDSPSACQLRLLQNIICNIDTPHDVRIVALHHYTDTTKEDGVVAPSIARLVQQRLDPWRQAAEITQLARSLASGEPQILPDLLDADNDDEGIQTASAAAALIDHLQANGQDHRQIAELVRNAFLVNTPALINAILYASIHSNPQSTIDQFRNCVVSELTDKALDRANVDSAMAFLSPLHGSVLAQLASAEHRFACLYIRTLVLINKRCQDTMLRDCIPSTLAALLVASDTPPLLLATSDLHLSRLAAKWLALLNQSAECAHEARTQLRKDQTRFSQLVDRISGELSKRPAVFDAVVEVWNAFYSQLQIP
ncbi:hypothetical protein EV175_000676 [Coemansia sp. RSA 1933]|nr:hypothetical protein EV175_000676 [Coemansia sp. RSA 1933]